MASCPVLIFGSGDVQLAFRDAYVRTDCISEGSKPGTVNAGDEILTLAESEGVVLLFLLNSFPDVRVPEGYVTLIRTKLLTI